MQEKRYVVTITAYVYATSDQQAVILADYLANKLGENDENRATVESLFEQPFGTISHREVKLNQE